MDKAAEAAEATEDEDDMPLSSWLKSQDAPEAKKRRSRPALKGLAYATSGGAQGGSKWPDRSSVKC